jgi:uncharacterized protein
MRFLSAKWNHLLLANYAVDPQVLLPYVPKGTSLDFFEGHAFVSLVAFMFNDTRVMGLAFPGHTNFEEVNLRFYVKPDHDPSIRAVTFIKEIVPKRLIPVIANNLFDENYVCLPMSHKNVSHKSVSYTNEESSHSYSWDSGVNNTFSAQVDTGLSLPQPGSVGEFITEHYWGYAGSSSHTREYQVEHPQWLGAGVDRYEISVDFASSYGPHFAFLNQMAPHNVQYAKGSEVFVSSPRRLR